MPSGRGVVPLSLLVCSQDTQDSNGRTGTGYDSDNVGLPPHRKGRGHKAAKLRFHAFSFSSESTQTDFQKK